MQCCKDISIIKELFAEHGISESLYTDNAPQFANPLFAAFSTESKFDHNMSAPRNPWSNAQAGAAVNFVKGLLTYAKCSGQDPFLALLAYWSTTIDAHLCSPTELL